MKLRVYDFRTVVFSKEININKIANQFNIFKKYKWEDPFILKSSDLKGIIEDTNNEKYIYMFSFGSCVFINMNEDEIKRFIEYIESENKSGEYIRVNRSYIDKFYDDFSLEINEKEKDIILDDKMVISEIHDNYLDIISIVLAKSVALERVEHEIFKIFDKFEPTLDILESGKLNIRDKYLAKQAASILNFKYATVSYIMIDETPDLAWQNSELAVLYEKLSKFFDLEDRYESVIHKIDILMTILDNFTNLVHAHRSTMLEWWIIALFIFEIVLSFIPH
jgi:required for meiotic nuclear division protein 1